MATNLAFNECVIFVQSKKIGTHENKDIYSKFNLNCSTDQKRHNKPNSIISEYEHAVTTFSAITASKTRHARTMSGYRVAS